MKTVQDLKRILRKKADPERAKNSLWFFKTGKGDYGEGDVFLGINNPTMRKIAKEFSFLTINDLSKIIKSKFHEERQIALFVLALKFNKAISRKNQRFIIFI